MNGLRSFFTFIGVYVGVYVGVRVLAYFSNKVFDSVSDYLYYPAVGCFTGYIAMSMAADRAIGAARNESRTRKAIAVGGYIIYGLCVVHGLAQIVVGIFLDLPLLDLEALWPHWLFSVPFGAAGLFASHRVKNNQNDILDY